MFVFKICEANFEGWKRRTAGEWVNTNCKQFVGERVKTAGTTEGWERRTTGEEVNTNCKQFVGERVRTTNDN